jgi:hypothetical protein
MNLLRIAKTVCSLAAVAALTACGGGGEKGPAWAQDLKTTLTTAPDTVEASRQFSPGTYDSACSYISNLPLSDAQSLQASEVISYAWVETATGTKLQTTYTIYSTGDCSDTGSSVLLKITVPLANVTRAGAITLAGLKLDASQQGVEVGASNLIGERILIEQPAGEQVLVLSNGAVYAADEVDPDTGLTNVKVVKDASGNVIYRQILQIDENTLKDSLTVQNGVLYRGVTEDLFDDSFDEFDYPRYVSLEDPYTKR